MAKKKPTHHDKPPQNQDHAHQSPPATMDGVSLSDKLENLKSLNTMLLKQAVERRQEVDSLQRSKGSLESALTRSESENREMQAELTRLRDRAARLVLERDLVSVFVAEQVGQQAEAVEEEREGLRGERAEVEERVKGLERDMDVVMRERSEIEKVCGERESEIRVLEEKLSKVYAEMEKKIDGLKRVSRERDGLRTELDVQIEETNGLRLELVESEKRGRVIEEEVKKLKAEYNGVVKGKRERERRIEEMMREKGEIERSLGEANRVIEGLKREIEGIVREKEGVEEERDVEVVKKNELQVSVAALDEMVLGLQKEEKKLRAIVLDLEKRVVVGEAKEKEMEREISELVSESEERERSFESLVEENGWVKKELDGALKELDEHKQRMEEVIRKKVEIEAEKVVKESEIVEMQREVSELRLAISALEVSCRDQTERNGQLQSEVSHCWDTIKIVTSERDVARRGFDEEKKNGVILREKVSEMEKKIEETQKVVDDLNAGKLNVIGEKKELEIKCTKLVKEIKSMEISLSKARKEVDEVQAKVESSDANLELVLKTLRSAAAAMVCASKEGVVKENDGLIDEMKLGESVKPYVAELEAIENAFKNREIEVEDMKKQLEHLQNSVAEARKAKNFLTLVSSATAILAAAVASVAYVARGR